MNHIMDSHESAEEAQTFCASFFVGFGTRAYFGLQAHLARAFSPPLTVK